MEKHQIGDFDSFNRDWGFYKGNLHSHTTNSDGRLTPEESAEYYRSHGYSFLALTDHNVYSDYRNLITYDDFMVFPGTEASILWCASEDDPLVRKAHHLLAFPDPRISDCNTVRKRYGHLERYAYPRVYGDDIDIGRITLDFIRELKDRGYILCYNHPVWSRVLDSDFLDLPDMDFLEIYNWGSELDSNSGLDNSSWQKMLDRGMHRNAIATDDNHNAVEHDDSFGGFVVVNAERLAYEDIMMAMLDGRYYASSGAGLDNWGIRDGKAYLECRDASKVIMKVGPDVVSGVWPIESDGDVYLFDIPEGATYFRFEVTDRKGRMAWTNPHYLV